jgi:DNA primase
MKWQEKFREVDRVRIVEAGKKSIKKKEGEKALEYLRKERGFTDEVIDKFEFGYCPEYISHQLKGRIILPLYDPYGNLLAVSSKHLNKNHPRRFWHESFDKKSNLFGLNFAKYDITKHNRSIVVEGEYDAIYLHSKGFTMSVAICGSSFSVLQSSLLTRYCTEVFFVFDGDEAGYHAEQRVKKIYRDNHFSSYGITYFYAKLPAGKDPDDFVKENGVDELKNILKKSRESAELDLD